MSRKVVREAQRITVDTIATVAASGVARALEARYAAGRELNSEELSHISGGNSFYPDSPDLYNPYPIYTMGMFPSEPTDGDTLNPSEPTDEDSFGQNGY